MLSTKVILVAVLCYICTAQAGVFTVAQYAALFKNFITKFKKAYSASSIPAKLATFKANLEKITLHNSKKETFTMAVNELTDLTPAEFKKMLGFKTDVKGSLLDADAETEVAGDTSNLAEAQLNLEDLPQSVDWSKHFGSKWRIRSQGQCGSCWSFSAASMIESTHAIANKLTTPLDVSEQELLDCTSRTSSCNGGYFVDAARYVKANGISLESKYKYAGYQQPCNSGVERSDVRIRTVEQIPRTEIAHMAAVARSPLVVGLHAEGSLQFYQSGIVTSCSPYPNHAVTLVGYSSALIDRQTGREQFKAVKEADMPRMWKLDYFLIRNSWGSGWGENGNFRIARNACIYNSTSVAVTA